MAKRMIFALAILGVLLVCGIGYAYTPDIIGLNVRSAAMAGAFTALAEGPAAAFYNPAALALRDEIQMEAGFMYTLGAFDLDRKSEDGELLENTDELDDALETNGVQYLGLGVSGRIYDYVGLGVFFNVPVDGRPHDKFFPPDTPYWLRYENSLQGYQIFPAVAVKIRPNICVGLGIGVIADMGGDIDTRVPLTGGDTEVVSMGKSKTAANAALNAGVFYRPLEWLRVGFSYRGANYIKHEKTLNVKLLYGDASLPVDIDVLPGRVTVLVP